jgi:hypothetical protein
MIRKLYSTNKAAKKETESGERGKDLILSTLKVR